MSVVYLESEEGKGELRWLLSILRQSYGPLGMYVILSPYTFDKPELGYHCRMREREREREWCV